MYVRWSLGSFRHKELHLTGAGAGEHRTITDDTPFGAVRLVFTSALVAGRPPAPDLLEAWLALGAEYPEAKNGLLLCVTELHAPARIDALVRALAGKSEN